MCEMPSENNREGRLMTFSGEVIPFMSMTEKFVNEGDFVKNILLFNGNFLFEVSKNYLAVFF